MQIYMQNCSHTIMQDSNFYHESVARNVFLIGRLTASIAIDTSSTSPSTTTAALCPRQWQNDD